MGDDTTTRICEACGIPYYGRSPNCEFAHAYWFLPVGEAPWERDQTEKQ